MPTTVGTGSQRLRCAAVLAGLLLGLSRTQAVDVDSGRGQRLAHDVYKGNCLACHQMARNPQTVMPPFGKHKILTEEEIDLIIDYIYEY